MKKKLLLPLLALFAYTTITRADQRQWDYQVDFRLRLDNREYRSEYLSGRTFFGLRLVPEIRYKWGGNSLAAGADLTRDFGTRGNFQPDPELLLNYKYDDRRNFRVCVGAFRRDEMSGFPSVFTASSKSFYDGVFHGFTVRWRGNGGMAELIGDWYARRCFAGYFNGRVHLGQVYSHPLHLGTYTMMNRFDTAKHVLSYLFAGYELGRRHIRAGLLQSKESSGFMADVHWTWRSFGTGGILYLGDSVMPLWAQYGSKLYFGDPLFRTTHGIYSRAEFSWQPHIGKGMSLRLSSLTHYDGRTLNWQQVVAFSATIWRKN
ncbi:MAG: hypothetical protein FWE10_04885 [Rikenellaceae bacterium]|nr:hypothetical protein [Rikenellaceae bacterium]MCL2692433.1 hypothetical protein [Rikenellaceae bacterium]